MVKRVFQASPFHLFLSCICNAENLNWFDANMKMRGYYLMYPSECEGFVRQLLKISSVQCRYPITDKMDRAGFEPTTSGHRITVRHHRCQDRSSASLRQWKH